MPVQMLQGLTGLIEQMACRRIDREADLIVGAYRSAAFDLHSHLLIAVGLDVQQGQATEPLDKGDRSRDRSTRIDMQSLRSNP